MRLTPVAWQSTGHGRSSGLTPCAGSFGLRYIVVTMQLRAFHGILGWEPGVALLTQLHPRLPSAVLRTQDFARLRRVCFSTNPHWAKSLGHMCYATKSHQKWIDIRGCRMIEETYTPDVHRKGGLNSPPKSRNRKKRRQFNVHKFFSTF